MIELVGWAKEFLRIGSVAFIVVTLVLGAVLSFIRPRLGRAWILLLALGYWMVSTRMFSTALVAPLARGYHSIQDPHEADGAGAIVVLGGGIGEWISASGDVPYLRQGTALRVLEGARLFHLLGDRPFVVPSGGTAKPGQRVPEAHVMAESLERLGVPRDRIILEDRALTTREEALLVPPLLTARGVNRFVLVTSPMHMARSAAVFRAQNADVIPSLAPLATSNFNDAWSLFPQPTYLEVSDDALYDYAGTLYYWARGWFRPVPRPPAP